jgi:hypothetical protein
MWQLTSIGMLGWGAAAAAPILIHLFTRRKFKRVTWAAMEFLIAAAKKNQQRIQLQQWLLLAVVSNRKRLRADSSCVRPRRFLLDGRES